jgi:hypothetical protein
MEEEIRNEEMNNNEETIPTYESTEETSGGIGTGVAMLLGAALAVGIGAGGKKLYGFIKKRRNDKLKEDLEKVEEKDIEVVLEPEDETSEKKKTE